MGGGTGGSTSGEVAFPVHMTRPHQDWLEGAVPVAMTDSVVNLMNTAQAGASPFAGFATADSEAVMGWAALGLTPFQAVEDLDALNLQNIFDTFFAALDNAAARTAIVAAETTLLDTRMTADILPEFQRGIGDIVAVLTIGFTVGEANMSARDNLSVDKLDAELQLQSRRIGWELSFKWVQLTIEWNKVVAALIDEVSVRYLEARYKGDQLDMEMSVKNVLFDLEVYQYGANLLASISGAATRGQPETSMISAALGGVMSGAATGAAIGSVIPVLGTATGAAVGALLGLGAAIF